MNRSPYLMKSALYVVTAIAFSCTTAYASAITVSYSGEVNPTTAPVIAQPSAVSIVGQAQIQTGQPGDPGNPPLLPNNGWNPYGTSDHTHSWWNLYTNSSVTFDLSGSSLSMVWGSPNDNSYGYDNTVSFYTGANGGGTLIGTVQAADLYAMFGTPPIDNNNHAGYLISFATPEAFQSVTFGTSPSDFEFAVTGVPEASTWAMMFAGFAGLGLLGLRRSRPAIALSL
jgi:hypothetical protein